MKNKILSRQEARQLFPGCCKRCCQIIRRFYDIPVNYFPAGTSTYVCAHCNFKIDINKLRWYIRGEGPA